MFDLNYTRRLSGDLDRWVAKGWVSAEGADNIRAEQDEGDGKSHLPLVLGGIGVVCVALAVIAFIAANWDGIPKIAKLVGIVVLVVASHLLAAYTYRREMKAIADLATAFATLVFVGGMALVGQIFHLPQDWAGGAFLIALGGLAAAWITGSRTALIVAAVAVISWQFNRPDLDGGGITAGLVSLALLAAVFAHPVVFPAFAARWAAIAVLLATYGRWLIEATGTIVSHRAGDPVELVLQGAAGFALSLFLIGPVLELWVKWCGDRPAKPAGLWAMLAGLRDLGFVALCWLGFFALVFSGEYGEPGLPSGWLAAPAFLPIALAAVLALSGAVMAFKSPKYQMLVGAGTLAGIASLLPTLTDNILALCAFSLAALVGLCALAAWFGNRLWTVVSYLALTAAVLWLLEVTIGSLLGQSVFFLVAGLLLLAMAWWVVRLLRKGARPAQTASGEAES